MPGAVKDADNYLEKHDEDTLRNLDKVSALVSGFETSFGLELLSTVHWVIDKESANSDADTVEKVHAWNSRKQRFTPHQILLAKSWLDINSAIEPKPATV